LQDATTQSELHSLSRSGDLLPIPGEPIRPQALEENQRTETLKEEAPLAGAPSPVPLRASRFQHSAPVSFSLPGRGLSIASVLSALRTILILLINTGTFHAVSLQIALNRLTAFVMGFRVHEREQLILNRALVCRMCSTDISASFLPKRVSCCRCENKLRLAARRIAFVHKCLIENCW
jgi:hypothetical protein